MKVNYAEVEETFAEAFPMYCSRILITALNEKWALTAAQVATGFASSIIMSPAEAAVENVVSPTETPDNRVGVLIQIYHRSLPDLKGQLVARMGQCVLTCPTTRAFDALPEVKRRIRVGRTLSKFGDGFEKKDRMFNRDVWRIPVMEGEFIVEDSFGVVKAVAGGNILILAEDEESGLRAAEEAISAVRNSVKGVIAPFPGGIVRSGSKVGSLKYAKLAASTNHLYCPTLRDVIKDSKVPQDVKCVYELVFNGLNVDLVKKAMGLAALAASKVSGVKKIAAANYGGKLGPYKISLAEAIEKAK
ncbi:MAG: formylmethanofuran--tetrahydromethanopterin N-formyltransferase [Candidatus Methanomethylicota archaeon]|uniref:Formylmethanofuran--tetrahydromethanopterin N-formyltransferase n=1 Tax=Thermoproteota archaeon TaxID=2056631 RepID=A0A497EQC2_9CREN|nr:MAG: formylmethanofuran--tetrahydromethanopterin N-formyltransferase [Candidatus Verstraetearchaeota archaeon]